jgi:two-component system, NarL family, sensor histidine kinase FusK
MGTRHRNAWWRHVAVAVAYALTVLLFRVVIIPHWVIVCGLHVAVLLLVPYRYWPALFVGEAALMLKTSIECESQFGLLWSSLNVIPPTLVASPIVYWARKNWHVFKQGEVNIRVLLTCIVLVATVATLDSLGSLAITPLPPGYVVHWGEVAAAWLLGNYLGALTIVPVTVAVYQSLIRKPTSTWLAHLADSKLPLEAITLLFPVMAILVWIGDSAPTHTNTRQIAQIAAFLPVVWMALRHGWKGAAAGGMGASFAIILLMPEQSDHVTMQAEVLCAFMITTMLIIGGHVAEMDRQAEQERLDVRKALELAQRNAMTSERHLKIAAAALDQVRDNVERGFTMMMGRLRVLQPAISDGGYQRHAATTQDQIGRLADALYPNAWRDRGLPAALQEGTVAKALQECGFRYACDFRGAIGSLPQPVRMAIYRSTIEAIADVCAKRNTAELTVQVRSGHRHGRQWALTTLTFRGHPISAKHVRWEELLPVLLSSTSGLGWQAVQDRALTFEGHARERMITDGRRISILLLVPISSAMKTIAEPSA